MVNVVAVLKPIIHGLVKLAGLRPQTVEIEPGTVIHFWVPKQAINNNNTPKWNKPNKPVLVFAHPFAEDGILMWFHQVLAFSGKYAVYVPDFLFFGGSVTERAERSAAFQAECLAKGLRKLGVERCTVVGLSYGGMVGFKMAAMYPDLVEAMVVSSTVFELTDSITDACYATLGISRWSELLLPESVEGVKLMFSMGAHKWPKWLPHFVYKDFLEVMFDNRKEKAELLESLVVKDEDSTIPNYPQRIHFLWGDDDKFFNLELAQNMKERLGEKATLQWIKNAGHLVQLERPFAYNHQLKRILSSIY
ncbi:Epoxide hydrolase [Actinidia chinensis var. chinensis]|uniref:Epoxide hydrolase n=2 Tax=Actinidia TaxID=3624 RepID=A0A2R6RHC3_ACTCC|nr:Epoxide hydrolase [Actinidia chinensis var. chinensis]